MMAKAFARGLVAVLLTIATATGLQFDRPVSANVYDPRSEYERRVIHFAFSWAECEGQRRFAMYRYWGKVLWCIPDPDPRSNLWWLVHD